MFEIAKFLHKKAPELIIFGTNALSCFSENKCHRKEVPSN